MGIGHGPFGRTQWSPHQYSAMKNSSHQHLHADARCCQCRLLRNAGQGSWNLFKIFYMLCHLDGQHTHPYNGQSLQRMTTYWKASSQKTTFWFLPTCRQNLHSTTSMAVVHQLSTSLYIEQKKTHCKHNSRWQKPLITSPHDAVTATLHATFSEKTIKLTAKINPAKTNWSKIDKEIYQQQTEIKLRAILILIDNIPSTLVANRINTILVECATDASPPAPRKKAHI